jgi:hypothetical protein
MRAPTKPILMSVALLGLAVAPVSRASASANLILNSGFATAVPQSQVIEGAYSPTYDVWEPTTVIDWTAGGTFDLIVYPGEGDDTTILHTGFALYGPANGYANGLTATGPSGGNYVALDGGFPGDFSQTIAGLVTGKTYNLSFYFATAQEIDASGPTTETLTVSLGTQSFSTPTVTTPNAGFTPWTKESFSFVYNGSGDVLSFLATGAGAPPYSLINDPTLTTGTVPELSTWAMMGLGFALLGYASFRSRRRKATAVA